MLRRYGNDFALSAEIATVNGVRFVKLLLYTRSRWPFLNLMKSTAAFGFGNSESTPSLQERPPSCDSLRTNHPSGRPA